MGKIIRQFYLFSRKWAKKTIKDVKNFVTEKSISELNNPVCPCFLLIYKLDEKREYINKCYDYKDETFLDDTVFCENNPIKVCIPIEGKVCKCGGLYNNETLSKIVKKMKEEKEETEKKKKESEEKLEKKINELNLNNQMLMNQKDDEIQRQRKDFQNFINFQKQLHYQKRMENNRILQNLESNLR